MIAYKTLDTVRLLTAVPAEGLAAGSLGTVLEVFNDGAAYLVEFCDHDGGTRAMPTLKPGDLAAAGQPAVHG